MCTQTPPSSTTPKEQQLPVVIAGAGPCGLTAALTLQKQGIPFVLYERASREKLCSNAGSGIDMAPSAVDILEDELGVDMDKAMRPYEYMYVGDMKGKHISTYRFNDMKVTATRPFGFANRAWLQQALLDALGIKQDKETDHSVLKCGITVTGYEQTSDHVLVTLSDNTTVQASVLLACDGIHSAVRKHMHRNVEDDLHYCGQECWWGKTTVRPGSNLDKELQNMNQDASTQDGNVAITLLGTPKRPGTFFSCEVAENSHAWVYVVKNKTPPAANQTNDLTRRGGAILTPEEKQRELEDLVANRADLLRLLLAETPASDITKAGIFDRENMDLSYVDGRVALLGDAAHPQSPMMGQGANMAIVDGYVMGTRLAASNMLDITATLTAYDCKMRRKSNNSVIKEARKYGHLAVSKNRFTCWGLKTALKVLPSSMMMSELIKGDKSNQDFLAATKKEVEVAAEFSI